MLFLLGFCVVSFFFDLQLCLVFEPVRSDMICLFSMCALSNQSERKCCWVYFFVLFFGCSKIAIDGQWLHLILRSYFFDVLWVIAVFLVI